jgi:hypothetical protein
MAPTWGEEREARKGSGAVNKRHRLCLASQCVRPLSKEACEVGCFKHRVGG